MGGYLLRHRDFRLLWGGETISELGSQVSGLALPLVAVRVLHATTFEVGSLTAASSLGFLLVGLPAGAWADRLRRRRLMIAADVGRLAMMASVPVTYAFGASSMVQLYVVAFAAGVLTLFFDVSCQSYLPFLVGLENVAEGNAKLTGSAEAAQIGGPSLAGVLVQAIGGPYAVAVDAASFLVSAVALGSVRAAEPAPVVPAGERAPVRKEIGEGLRYVFGQPLLRAIAMTTAWSNLFSGLMTAVEIVFLVRVVHAAPGIIGLLLAAVGVGGLIGATCSSPLARRLGGARATMLGIGCNLAALVIPLTRPGAGLVFFAGGYGVTAFGTVVYNVNQLSFRQRLTPERLLGRMNATMRFVVWGVLPIGALLGGAAGTTVGLRPSLWLAAVGEALGGAWLVMSPMRHMRDFPGHRLR
jgi:predicted MFS family arabinose efflux permease